MRAARRRPRSVTVVALGVLTIAGLNTARVILALVRWQALDHFPGVPQFYIACTGAVWAVAAWSIAWGVWRGETWAPRVMRLAVLVYSGYYWLDRLFMANRTVWFEPVLPVNWLFAAGLNGFVFWLVYWTLSRPISKKFFGELNE
jgi:hypothetical protein